MAGQRHRIRCANTSSVVARRPSCLLVTAHRLSCERVFLHKDTSNEQVNVAPAPSFSHLTRLASEPVRAIVPHLESDLPVARLNADSDLEFFKRTVHRHDHLHAWILFHARNSFWLQHNCLDPRIALELAIHAHVQRSRHQSIFLCTEEREKSAQSC